MWSHAEGPGNPWKSPPGAGQHRSAGPGPCRDLNTHRARMCKDISNCCTKVFRCCRVKELGVLDFALAANGYYVDGPTWPGPQATKYRGLGRTLMVRPKQRAAKSRGGSEALWISPPTWFTHVTTDQFYKFLLEDFKPGCMSHIIFILWVCGLWRLSDIWLDEHLKWY